MKYNTLTINQYYKGLNNRYDNRVKKLIKLGFSLHRETMLWYKGYFTYIDAKNNRLLSNEVVFHSDKRFFNDKLNS